MGSVSIQAIRQCLWLLAINLVGMVEEIVQICMRGKHIGVKMRRDGAQPCSFRIGTVSLTTWICSSVSGILC